MRGLFWFRKDLRLHDNPALLRMAEQCDELILVYCFDDRKLKPGRFQSKGIAAPRMAFLTEALGDLATRIQKLGQRLIIRRGDPSEVVSQLIRRYSVDCLGATILPGPEERKLLDSVKERFPRLEIFEAWSHTLFSPQQLGFSLDQLPNQFSSFLTLVQQRSVSQAEPAPEILPPPPLISRTEECDPLPKPHNDYSHSWVPPHWFGFQGGESAGLQQLNHYLWERHQIRRYSENRNGLIGWDYSSKLSPWLAMGCLSVRQYWQAIRRYESFYGSCESTYQLGCQLLWREFFQWLLYTSGEQAFQAGGVMGKRRLLTFYPEFFMAWSQGTTGIPIVDACMRELKTTGWLSGRGRRIVADFLVNELGVDWRYGAAWFEQQLIDYDPALCWGNWSYFACTEPPRETVGAVLAQAYSYDPEAEYVSLWLPELEDLPQTQRHTPFWSRKPGDYRYPIVDVSVWRKAQQG